MSLVHDGKWSTALAMANGKDTSRDRDQVPAEISASDLGETSAPSTSPAEGKNPVNRPIQHSWRQRAQHKGTWIGARISNGSALGAIEELAQLRSDVEIALREEVERARTDGYPWSRIGSAIGTTPEAARQRYGR